MFSFPIGIDEDFDAKVPFLKFVPPVRVEGATNRGRLDEVNAKVRCLCGELEASQKTQEKLSWGFIDATQAINSTKV